MRRTSVALLAWALATLGCHETITVVAQPDGGPPIDAAEPPPVRAHCEITGTAWQDLGSPLEVGRVLDYSAHAIAMHDGTLAIASRLGIATSDGDTWSDLPRTGLPPTAEISAIAFARGAWWIVAPTFGFDPEDAVFSWSGVRWVSHGTPDEGATYLPQLLVLGDALLVQSATGLYALDPGETSTWRAITFGEGEVPSDVVVTSRFAYVSTQGSADLVRRSADLVTWEVVPHDASVQPLDLVAGPGMLIAHDTVGGGVGSAYLRLDEDDASPSLARVDLGGDGFVPLYVAADGTAMTVVGATPYFARTVGDDDWRPVSDLDPIRESTGLAFVFRIASEGAAIVIPTGVDGGVRVVRSDDHGRTFRAAVGEMAPAPVQEIVSDGTTFLTRLAGNDGASRTYAHDGDAWEERTALLPDPGSTGLTGIEGFFVTRTSSYARQAPFASSDGGRTWASLDLGFPAYATNAGPALRQTSGFAADAEGRLYAATMGGQTAICCTGSKVGWRYRPGAGVWRFEHGGWSPLNAGIPVEVGPDGFGGPPFRSDIAGIAATRAGIFAVLTGRGVYALVADRWAAATEELPVDPLPTVLGVDDTAAAWTSAGLYVLEDGAWSERGGLGTITSVVSRVDLLIHASDAGSFSSADRGETWTDLPALEGSVRLALTRERLVAVTNDHRHHALAVTCTEAP